MKNRRTIGEPTPLQKIIIEQISRHLDEDSYCRMTNADLGKICSDVKKKRLCKEVSLLVSSGYLRRELQQHKTENYTERRLRLTPKAGEHL